MNTDYTERRMVPYRLPDGTVVQVDDSAAKGLPFIDFTLEAGLIVQAERVHTITVTQEVRNVDLHMVTVLESPFGHWFRWSKAVGTEQGYASAVLEAEVAVGDGWMPARIFTTADFVVGLQRWVTRYGAGGDKLAHVQYLGDGEWDIDSPGADAVVQMAVYGYMVFG